MKKKTHFDYKANKKIIILGLLTLITMIVYVVWRAGWSLPSIEEYGVFAFVLGIALLIAETASIIEALVHCVDSMHKMEPEMPIIPDEWFPDVDVFIATHNEEEDILFKTVNGCVNMKYPDMSKVHIYICDDGNRQNVSELAERMGVGCIQLKNNTLAKAGNLNNAISLTNSPLIVTFDADMIPNSNFLIETVPYFFIPKMKKDEEGNWIPKEEEEIDENEKIGFIQTPQSFYNPDLFQYNLYSEGRVPNEQDYFFRQVNVERNSANAPIYAGSNTVISREALEEVGGICTGTITEDFETGLLIEAKGYKCYAVDKLLAKGLAPTTVSSLIKQRERWGRGCVYSLRRHHILLNPKFPFKLKMAYFASRNYWGSFFRRFIFVIAPVLFVLLGIPAVVCTLKELLFIWVPAYLLYSITLKTISSNIRNTRLSNIIDTIMFPYLMVPILAEIFHIHKQEFVVTNKNRRQDDSADKLLAIPHCILLVLSVIALVFSIKDMILYQAFGSLIVIYWLATNSISFVMAIFFMLGRKNNRTSERFSGHIPLMLMVNDDAYEAVTEDFSEGGMAIVMDDPIYINDESKLEIWINDRGYRAKLNVILASANETKDKKYKYSFQIVDLDEENKKSYMQIVFDREHTLPKKISKSSSIYGDITSNIMGRMSKMPFVSRKQVRLDVNKEYPVMAGDTVKIINFNFEYVLLDVTEDAPEKFEIQLEKGLSLICHRQRQNLYKVDNLGALQSDIGFQKIITEWGNHEKK